MSGSDLRLFHLFAHRRPPDGSSATRGIHRLVWIAYMLLVCLRRGQASGQKRGRDGGRTRGTGERSRQRNSERDWHCLWRHSAGEPIVLRLQGHLRSPRIPGQQQNAEILSRVTPDYGDLACPSPSSRREPCWWAAVPCGVAERQILNHRMLELRWIRVQSGVTLTRHQLSRPT